MLIYTTLYVCSACRPVHLVHWYPALLDPAALIIPSPALLRVVVYHSIGADTTGLPVLKPPTGKRIPRAGLAGNRGLVAVWRMGQGAAVPMLEEGAGQEESLRLPNLCSLQVLPGTTRCLHFCKCSSIFYLIGAGGGGGKREGEWGDGSFGERR